MRDIWYSKRIGDNKPLFTSYNPVNSDEDTEQSSSALHYAGEKSTAAGSEEEVAIPMFPHFVCDHCSRIFNRKYVLDRHNKTVHNILHKCTVCQNVFASKRSLKNYQDFEKLRNREAPCDIRKSKLSLSRF